MLPIGSAPRRLGRAPAPRRVAAPRAAATLAGLLLAAAPGAPALATSAGQAPGAPPDVVVILADDLGYADLGIQGGPDVRTPNIDRIARGGLQFTDGYVSAPQCTPSRAGLLTGRYAQRFRYARNDTRQGLPAGERTLAEALRDAGYATAAIGKWHLGLRLESNPLEHGFDEFFGIPGGVSRYLPDPNLGFLPGVHRDRAALRETEELTTALGREARAFVERNADAPLFLYLAFTAPHFPLEASPSALARTRLPDGPRRTYAAMVATMDDAVGALLETLRDSGREENALLFFLSDNGGATHLGGASNAPFRGSKKTLAEGGIRVPFLVRWPRGLPGGRIVGDPVIQLDVYPTALAAAGIPVAPDVDGTDLAATLRDGSSPRSLYWRFAPGPDESRRQWAIRRGPWKLLAEPGAAPILVDLPRDPAERVDRSADAPAIAASLREAWAVWNAALPDTWSAGPLDAGELGAEDEAPEDTVAVPSGAGPSGE